MFSLKLNKFNMCDFHPLEVVDRSSKTQLQLKYNSSKIRKG